MPSTASSDDEPTLHSLPEHQRAAAASPHTSITDLVGNFTDLESLFDRLGEPNLIELGNPLPQEKFLPRKRAGSCQRTHNEELLANPRRASA